MQQIFIRLYKAKLLSSFKKEDGWVELWLLTKRNHDKHYNTQYNKKIKNVTVIKTFEKGPDIKNKYEEWGPIDFWKGFEFLFSFCWMHHIWFAGLVVIHQVTAPGLNNKQITAKNRNFFILTVHIQRRRPVVFCKKGVLKKETLAQVFPVNFVKILKAPFL